MLIFYHLVQPFAFLPDVNVMCYIWSAKIKVSWPPRCPPLAQRAFKDGEENSVVWFTVPWPGQKQTNFCMTDIKEHSVHSSAHKHPPVPPSVSSWQGSRETVIYLVIKVHPKQGGKRATPQAFCKILF